jgi:SepF-like predicted cell division protein (DUF552 family)
MEPQQENKQSNSNEPIRIIPNRNGVVPSDQNTEGKNFFHPENNMNNVAEKKTETPLLPNEEKKIAFHPSENTVKISPIHTYADDVKNTVQNDGISMAKIVMAEAKKQEAERMIEEELSPSTPKNRNIIVLSVIMILVACVGFVGVWYFIGNRNTVVNPVAQQHKVSIIPYDEEFDITLDSIERKKVVEGLLQAKKQSYQSDTSIVYTPVAYKESTSTSLVSTNLFLSMLDVRISSALMRAFDSTFMLGINKNADQVSSFILLTSGSFNQMYAGMLEWETAMADDIGDLFFTKADLVEVPPVATSSSVSASTSKALVLSTSTMSTSTFVGTNTGTTSVLTQVGTTSIVVASTSSSTPIVNEADFREFKSRYIIANSLIFKDEIFNNRDMRVLRTTSGKILMYYTFINDRILLIAKDLGTLDEIVKRLATSQFKQ